MCISLGLKKLGDFTVSEGHEYPLVSKIIIISGDSSQICRSSSSNNCKFEGTCKRYFLCGKKYFSKYKEVLLSASTCTKVGTTR